MGISILYSLDSAAATVCLFSAFLLFTRAGGIRARKVLGGTLLIWGIIYLLGFARIGEIEHMSERGFMPAFGVIGGTIAGCSLMFYMLEVMRSGWLSLKRGIIILSPYFLSIFLFVVIQSLSSYPIRHLNDPADFVDHIHEFNVWYRLVFLFITIVYVIAIITVYIRYAPRYRKWIEDNYSSTELMTITWFRYLLWGMVALCVIYFYAMYNKTILPLYIHYPAVILFFPYLTYKGLFQQNPYPKDFFRKSLLEEEIVEEEQTVYEKQNETAFTQKMEEYRLQFEQWIEKEKPYLNKDFKLADVNARYPMNRTYLARFFSETYGCSFSTRIKLYRVEEAQRILREQPDMISKELYHLCGFTSEAVFHRAFTEMTGLTPKQFRVVLMSKDDRS